MKAQQPSHVHISNEAYETVIAALYASAGEIEGANAIAADGPVDELLTLARKRLEQAISMLTDADHHHVPWRSHLPCACTTPDAPEPAVRS